MEDKEVIKALECCCTLNGVGCQNCPQYDIHSAMCVKNLIRNALDLINRQKDKIKEFDEKLIIQQGLIDYQNAEIERLKKNYEELIYKTECLLCHATGNKFSKYTYTTQEMISFVDDYIQDCCNEAVEEAKEAVKSEVIKEFAERLKSKIWHSPECNYISSITPDYIDQLVKEITEVETNQRKEDEGK